jgi:hypothetical protein
MSPTKQYAGLRLRICTAAMLKQKHFAKDDSAIKRKESGCPRMGTSLEIGVLIHFFWLLDRV